MKARLLSSGNPQIAKGDGDAPVEAYLDAMPGWKRDVGRSLDAIVREHCPDARRAVRWNTPLYGNEHGWFFSMYCFTRYVKLTFFRGTDLVPQPPGSSKVEGVRYLEIHEGEDWDPVLVADWIRQAHWLPGVELW